MTKTAFALAFILTEAACGRPTAISSVAPSQLSPPDAFQCVTKSIQSLGFQRTMYDQDDWRTSARKENPKITFSNTHFRKTWDRLDVDVQAGKSGTEVELTGVTEAEYFSQNGKNFTPVAPSEEVKSAALEVEKRCGGSAADTAETTDSVPSAQQ